MQQQCQVIDLQEVVDLNSIIDMTLSQDFLDAYQECSPGELIKGLKEQVDKGLLRLSSGLEIDVVIHELAKIVDFNGEYPDEVKLSIALAIALRRYGILTDPIDECDCRGNRFRVLAAIVKYLADLKKARTIVVERDYVDRDFLDDYARYYSRCFDDYKRKCIRLHFFAGSSMGAAFTQTEIEKRITHPDAVDEFGQKVPDDLQSRYLGFVVVRPLLSALVGRTYLIANETAGNQYRALQEFGVSFWGRKLSVRCMPFLQQDTTTAACATCALWSCSQVTSKLLVHKNYYPGCITAMSLDHGTSPLRRFPNNGLLETDMLYAIRTAGLDPVFFGVTPLTMSVNPEILTQLLGYIYAYVEAGIPMILVGDLYDKNASPLGGIGEVGWKGRHAVAINGYHLADNVETEDRGLRSYRIDNLFVHDDQIGPYASLGVKKGICHVVYEDDGSLVGEVRERWVSQWKGDNGEFLDFDPCYLIIPSYHKIRVDYVEIDKQFKRLDRQISGIVMKDAKSKEVAHLLDGKWHPEWDIKIQRSDEFKKDIRNDRNMAEETKLEHLKMSYPKYVWVMTLYANDQKQLTVLVDATDPGRVAKGVDWIPYTVDMAKILIALSQVKSQGSSFMQGVQHAVDRIKTLCRQTCPDL